jgi:PIN domain nuclease of toxin-antitoxin system
LIWAAADELPGKASQYINNRLNKLFFSSASIWEIVIKNKLGRKDFIVDPSFLYNRLLNAGYRELQINGCHTLMVSNLPMIHKDPFDRILIAQSATEGMSLLTSDSLLLRYPGSIIYVN